MPRLVDYFVVCGLKKDGQLEVDASAGKQEMEYHFFWCVVPRKLHITLALPLPLFPVSSPSLPPLCRCYTAHIIYHYPTNVSWNPFDALAVKTVSWASGLYRKTRYCWQTATMGIVTYQPCDVMMLYVIYHCGIDSTHMQS